MITVANKRLGGSGEYVGRPSPLGNPYRPKDRWSVGETLPKYEEWLQHQIHEGTAAFDELVRLKEKYKKEGKLTLLCWCAPGPCHADVIKKAIEKRWI